MTEVLRITDLRVGYAGAAGVVEAISGVDLTVHRGEIVGLVGESGSGKSTLMAGALRTLPPPGVILGGSARLHDQELMELDGPALRALRWSVASLVPQSAMASLNPVLTIGQHVDDTLAAHGLTDPTHARAIAALEGVQLTAQHLDACPHQLSGGMRQRVALALALLLEPDLVVFDEPTTALDVVVERSILGQVLELRDRLGFAAVFITHDLALLEEIADRIVVLYAGRVAESAPTAVLKAGALHPYAQGLLAAVPRLDGDVSPRSIPGTPPRIDDPPSGCRFHPRCPLATARCRTDVPPPREVAPQHVVACWEVAP